MRGKNILWISLIAMLLATMLTINVGTGAATNTKLSIDPEIIPTHPSDFGHPGDTFDMTIKIENIENVWAMGFIVQFAPYSRPLVVSEVKEGPFMKTGGYQTSFTFKINTFRGQLKIGISRLVTPGLPIEGAYGDGDLATFTFTVVEGGDSDIEFVDVSLLEVIPISEWEYILEPLDFQTRGGYYHGVTANLIGIELAGGRKTKVGETQTFNSKAKNFGDVSLCVRTRFDIERLEDGRRVRMYAGQRYLKGWLGEPPIDYLYVNDYTGSYEPYGFYHVGDAPYLDAIDSEVDYNDPGSGTGNYVWTDTELYGPDFCLDGKYDFEDIFPLGPDDVMEVVALEIYMATPPHEYGTDEHFDLDCVARAPGEAPPSVWIGSWCGIPEMRWVTDPQHVGTDKFSTYFPTLLTEAGLNDARLRYFAYYNEVGKYVGPVVIDAMRLRIEWSAFDPASPECAEIAPFSELVLDSGTLTAKSELVGTYVVTATLEYTLAGLYWQEGAKTRTVSWAIVP